jgi:dTDP-4-dehydrorhamnose reductase
MKKIYIAGGGGMLGEAFYNIFSKNYVIKCTDIDLNEDWIQYMDFRNYDEYLSDIATFKPDYLFHLGAITDLEQCEKNIKNAYLTNTLSVENATLISNKFDIPLLYISTAGIFDGKKDTYDDWDMPSPLGVYARTKYLAELFVQRHKKNHLICRPGWMMGGGPKKDKKFVMKILKQIKEGNKKIYVVNDKFGTPTYTVDFARNVKKLFEKEYWGLYNMVCQGLTSRFEVAKTLIKLINYESKIDIIEVNSDYFADKFYAPRPLSERLLNKKLELRSLDFMRNWEIALKEYLEDYFKEYIEF